MSSLPPVQEWLSILWAVSVQVTILAVFIWIIGLFAAGTALFRYALWSLVLLRLCLPMDFSLPVLPIGIEHHVRRPVELLTTNLFEPSSIADLSSSSKTNYPGSSPATRQYL